MKWEEKLEEGREILLWWYRKVGDAGHGEITVSFNQENCRVEVIPKLRVRDKKTQKTFEEIPT